MNIGKKILELRKENEVTQEQLGKILSVGKTTISNYENEYSTPDAENIAKIAKYFHVSADYILGLTNKKEKDPHNNPNYAGDEICKKLVEIGFLKEGELITDKDLEVLAEILAPQVEFSRFKLNQKQ